MLCREEILRQREGWHYTEHAKWLKQLEWWVWSAQRSRCMSFFEVSGVWERAMGESLIDWSDLISGSMWKMTKPLIALPSCSLFALYMLFTSLSLFFITFFHSQISAPTPPAWSNPLYSFHQSYSQLLLTFSFSILIYY